jgi:hypothetical protein
LLDRKNRNALQVADDGPKSDQEDKDGQQNAKRRPDTHGAKCAIDPSRIASRGTLAREIEAGRLQGWEQQKNAEAFGRRKGEHQRKGRDEAPARRADQLAEKSQRRAVHRPAPGLRIGSTLEPN